MTAEIISALAKVPDLRVVARTSVFEFKGQNRNIQSIGQQLHATHLIEGSVRKDGDRVRITVQLVKSDDGTNLWSENYDRELTGIFAVQEEIARAITASLRMPLGLKAGENLVNNRSIDPDDYQLFLRAKALVRSRGPVEPGGPLTEAAGLLESVVARDPDYAPAWALLALSYAYTPLNLPAMDRNGSVAELRRGFDASFPKAETVAERAVQLDPNSSDSQLSLALVQQFRGRFLLADESYAKSLALDPNNPDTLNQFSYHLAEMARIKEAVAMRQRLQELEPFVPAFNEIVAEFLWLDGQTGTAIAMYKAMPPARLTSGLARAYAASGRYSEAADALRALPPGRYLPAQVEEAVRLLRTAPAINESPQGLPRLGPFSFVYLHVGAPDRVLELHEDQVEAGWFGGGIRQFWHPSYAPARKTERFKALMRKAGLVDYWRVKGWPEFCRPTTGDDFICD